MLARTTILAINDANCHMSAYQRLFNLPIVPIFMESYPKKDFILGELPKMKCTCREVDKWQAADTSFPLSRLCIMAVMPQGAPVEMVAPVAYARPPDRHHLSWAKR